MSATVAAAQSPSQAPAPQQTEQVAPDKAEPNDGAAAPKTARPAVKPEGGKVKERTIAVLPLPPEEITAAHPECAWVGKRVVSLLVRDDVDTATDFTRFYAMFHCPEAHIAATFACVVSDPGAGREGAALTEHVELCWANPSTRILPQKPPNPDRPAPTAGKQ